MYRIYTVGQKNFLDELIVLDDQFVSVQIRLFTLTSLIVLSANGKRVWLRTKRCHRIYASNLTFLFEQLYVWIFLLNRTLCHSNISSTEIWQPVTVLKDFYFVLCEIDIHYKPSTATTNHPRYDDCQHVWILLYMSFAVLDRFFRLPQYNLE